MAAVTAGVIAAGASAASSIRGARQAENQQRAANQRFENAAIRNFGFNAGGMSGGFDPATGQLTTNLGSRLGGQQQLFDQLAAGFGNRDVAGELAPLQGLFGQMQGVAGMQPQTGDFSGLQNMIGSNLGLAQGDIGNAFGMRAGLQGFGADRFGQANSMFNEAFGGGSEAARSRTLDLLRQQAAPFEDRAFSNLQNNQFATGRLGSSGGALQTEAFARGLGQADLSRQLAANQEGRNFQQNALGLAQGFQNAGTGAASLGENLLGNAFNRFSGMARLASDVERQRFGQQMGAQNNAFNQLGQLFTTQTGLTGMNRDFQQQDLGNMLRLFGAGNALNQMPLDFLEFARGSEQMRSNAEIGGGTGQAGIQRGQSADALASLFGGLGTAAAGANGGGAGGFMSALAGMFGGGGEQ